MKEILITGGSGFIGANLCQRLLSQGKRVCCLDNNYTGSLSNIAPLLQDPNFRFVEHDVITPYRDSMGASFESIYHLACPASPGHYQGKHAILTTKTCVLGTINMLELAKAQGIRLLFSSTSEVYGDPTIHPQVESYHGNVNPNGIRACYDEGKRCAESLLLDYHRHEGVDVKIIRIFNTYGPLMKPDDGRVISNFICQALRGEDLSIYGRGEQTRSFQYIDDLLEAMQGMMESPKDIHGPINIGNPQEFTILQLAQKILSKIPNTGSQLEYKQLPQDDPCLRCPDIHLATQELGWQPCIPLDQGLDYTIQYFRKKLAQ